MAWINVDIPIKQIVYHANDECSSVSGREETQYRGVGEIKRDGGWLQFSDLSEVIKYHKEKYPDFAFLQHC